MNETTQSGATMMKRILKTGPLICLLMLYPLATFAGIAEELERLARLDRLAEFGTGARVEQISSYDRTGGNDDGFSGRYSFLRKEGENLVLAELEGPGVIQRIWTPTPTEKM